jgi:rhamnosyltransferase
MMITKLPRVAVLLAAYNGMEYIEEQLASILCQREVEVSVFISVDVSTDRSHEWCAERAGTDSRLHVLAYGTRFGGAAPNFFRLLRDVELDGFDFVSFADQDDIWLPEKLIRAVSKMTETCSAGYSSNVTAFWPDGKRKLVEKSQRQRRWDYLFEAAGPGCTYVLSPALAADIKRTLVNNWTLANQLGLHDWFSYAYARANGYNWLIDEWPSLLYRQHLVNQVGVNEGARAFLYRLKKVIVGWGIEQSALTAALTGKGASTFVRSWSKFRRLGFLKLAFNASECRRRPRDQVFFFCACLLLAIVGKRADV